MLNFLFKNKNKEPQKLFYSTDIHSHIIPGVDHGADSPEESLELLDAQKRWGINRLILTSHVTDTTFENTPETLAAGFEELKKALRENGRENDFTLEYSAEYRIDSYFMQQLEENKIRPFPGNYLLVENSFLQEPLGLDSLLFQLQTSGYRPILAHPERFPYYHLKPSRYRELKNRGILFQVNLLSLAGYHGKEAKSMAEKFAKEGMIDFLGSDLHHQEHVAAIDEYLASKQYTKLLPFLQTTVMNDRIKF